MPKDLLNKIGKNYADKYAGALAESALQGKSLRDHALNFAEASMSIAGDNLLIVGQYLAKNPKIAGVLGHAINYGYVDIATGICKDIIDNKSADEIGYTVAKNATAVVAGGTGGAVVGAFIGRNIGVVVGSAFGPVGAVAGLVIGQAVGGFVGGALGPIYAEKAVEAARDYISNKIDQYRSPSSESYNRENNRQSYFSKSDSYGALGSLGFGGGGFDGGSGGGGFGGGSGGGGFGGGNSGGFSFGNSSSGADSYLAGILGGPDASGSQDLSQFFNNAGSQTLASLLNSINSQDGSTGMGQFAAQLALEGLIASFNSFNGGQMAFGLGGLSGDIGGVATEAGQISGIKNSQSHLQNQFLICIRSASAEIPFSNQELKQLMGELAVGMFTQKTVPFFSLHFNEDGSLYPVIHPAYQNTLVGEVISYLDYFMKGFLNGGVFPKAFLDNWHKTMNTQRDYLKPNLIDLKAYTKQRGIAYLSLRQMMAEHGLQTDEPHDPNVQSAYATRFRTSFRIISKLNKVQQESNMFIVDADFDVEYTIDLMPDYKEYLIQYQMEKGKLPEDYLKIELIYRQMATQIKEVMPTLPFCKKYFDMLKVITFLSSYYKTLREMMKIPYLDNVQMPQNKVPKAFPPIPVRYYTFHRITITVQALLKQIALESAKAKLAGLLDAELLKVFEQGKNKFDEKLQKLVTTSIEALLIQALAAKYQGSLDENYVRNLSEVFCLMLVRTALSLEANFINQIDDINKEYAKDKEYLKIDKNILNSKPTLGPKFEYLCDVIKRNLSVRLKIARKELKEQYDGEVTKMDAEVKKAKVDFEAQKLKEFKEFQVSWKKQVEEAEKTRIANHNTFVVNLRQQGQTLINGQLAKIHVSLHSTYATQIQSMKNSVEQQIQTQIAAHEANSKQQLQSAIQTTELTTRNALKEDQEKRRVQMEAKIKQLKLQLEKNYKKGEAELPKHCELQNQQIIKQLKIKEQSFKTMTKTFLSSKQLCSMNLATKVYLNSQITIADKGYYQQVGDNFRIVGGCGVKLPSVLPQTVNFGKQVLAQVSKDLVYANRDSLLMQKIQNQQYMTFKTVCSDNRFSYDFHQLVNFFKKRSNELKQQEYLLLIFLMKKIPLKTLLADKKLDIKRVNTKGLSLGHLATVVSIDKENLSLLQTKDKEIFNTLDDFGNLPIHTSSTSGLLSNTQRLLEINKAYLQSKNSKGLTPLLCAVVAGNFDSVDLLLKMGANANYKLPNCLNALLFALEKGSERICLRLLSVAGIDVNSSMPSGDTALHLAIRLGMNQVASKIIPKFGDFLKAKTKSKGYNPLHEAASQGNHGIVDQLLKTGKIPVDTKTDAGDTALHLASTIDSMDTINVLLRHKANVNEENKSRETPLAKAIISNNEDVALVLSRQHAINKTTKQDKTCSLLACEHFLFEVFDALVLRGEDINKKDQFGNECASELVKDGQLARFTAYSNKIKNAKALVVEGASRQHNLLTNSYITANKLEGADFGGRKFLHLSIIADEIGMVKTWLEQNKNLPQSLASAALKDSDGVLKSIFYLAVENGSWRCLRTFIDHFTPKQILSDPGIMEAALTSGSQETIQLIASLLEDINQPLDPLGNTFAHQLIRFGLLQQVSEFQGRGLDLTVKTKANQSTVSLAIKNNDAQILQSLLELVPIRQYPPGSFNQILKASKRECYQVLEKKNKTQQIKCDQGMLLFSAVDSLNIDDLSAFLRKGYNPNQLVNNTTLLQHAISNNHPEIVDLLLEYSADPKMKVKNIDAIELALQSNKIEMLSIFQRRGKIALPLAYKSANPYTSAALANDFKPFLEAGSTLIECVVNLNLKVFQQKLKDFPLNERLSYKENTKQPILFYCFQYEFQAGIKLIADRVDPLGTNENLVGLAGLILKSSSPKELMGYIKKYFPKVAHSILAQQIRGSNILAIASVKGNQQILNGFLQYCDKLVAPLDEDGNLFIHLAVQSNNAEIVEKLLAKPVWKQRVNATNHKRTTPLMLASLKGNQTIAKMLLNCGANPNKTDIQLSNSLHYSLMASNTNNIFTLLLPLMRNINKPNRLGLTPLMIAALTGKPKEMARLVKRRAEISLCNQKGLQSIHFAAQKGDFDCLKILVEEGADVNAQIINPIKKDESTLETPAHLAAQSGNYKCLNYLFSQGANMNLRDAAGRTPVEVALSSKNKPLEKLIKQFPYYHNMENQWNLLKAAVVAANQHILKEFILSKFNVNITNKSGLNALHIAAMSDSPRCAAILLQEGISSDAKDQKGNTALHYAAEAGSQSVVDLLVSSKLDNQNEAHETALHIASKKNHLSIILTLLRNNSSLVLTNKIGMTAAQVALQNGHYQACEILVACGDVSLLPENIKGLPEYVKVDFVFHQAKLTAIQNILTSKMPSGILIALKLMNVDAVKLLLTIRPYQITISDPLTKKLPVVLAQDLKFWEAYSAIVEFNNLYKDVKWSLPGKQYKKGQQKNCPKALARKVVPFSGEEVCRHLKDQKKIDAGTFPGFYQYISMKSTQLCIMFCLGVDRCKNIPEFIKNWTAFLIKMKDHPSNKLFEEAFLTYYSWDFFFVPAFFQICEKVFFDKNYHRLEPWFFKYFEPLILFRPQAFRQKAVDTFSKFCDVLLKLNLLEVLGNPPRVCISFWLNQKNYIAECVRVLDASTNKPVQASVLGQLPEPNKIEEQIKNKNSVVCKHFTTGRAIKTVVQILQSLDLDIFQKDLANFVIAKYPLHLTNVMQYVSALESVSSEELTASQKLILSKLYLKSVDFTKPGENAFIFSFLELAKSVKDHLGLKIFELLFNNLQVVSTTAPLLNRFCKISELMIELDQISALEKMLKINMPNLDKVFSSLNEMYLTYLQNKYPEKEMTVLKKQFITKGQFVRQPLPETQFKTISDIYDRIVKQGSKLHQLPTEELKQIAQSRGKMLKTNPLDLQSKVIVLAVLREVIRHRMKILPYNTQILSILGLLSGDKKHLKGRIAQIRTGEGKSTIIAILSAYMALQGHFVDIITSSQYLARRDQEKYLGFYKMLGITSSHICENQPKKQMFNGQVLFGTNYDFQFSILRDGLYHSELRYTEREGKLLRRSCEVVIVDEVDSLFLDMALNSARLAIPSPFHTAWIYQIIFSYVEKQLKAAKPTQTKEVRSLLREYRKGLFAQTIDQYPDEKLQDWLNQAKKATELIENKNYVVRYDKEKSQMEVIIVDFENTGRLNVGSRWSKGLHQFVEVKHKIKPKDENLTAASMSHPAYFNQYQLIYGLTGTIGTEQERIEVQKIYEVDSFDVPPHFPSQRKRLPLQICEQKDYYKLILTEVQIKKKSRQPTLVLMKSINQTQKFSSFLKGKGVKHLLLNQMQKEDEDFIVSKAGLLDSVVVATNTAGRGTDIILTPEAKKAGGLHVIFAFYPANSRVEDQGLGRAGRQGQMGSCQVVVHKMDEEYCKYKQAIPKGTTDVEAALCQLRQQKIRSLSLVRQKQSIIQTIKYRLLKSFCEQLDAVRERLPREEAGAYLNNCIYFRYEPSVLYEELKENPLIEQIIRKGTNLLRLQSKGQSIDWTPFLVSLIEEQPNLILQQWGVFYSNMIESQILDEKQYEALIIKAYDYFSKRVLLAYKLDLPSKIKAVIAGVLHCSYQNLTHVSH